MTTHSHKKRRPAPIDGAAGPGGWVTPPESVSTHRHNNTNPITKRLSHCLSRGLLAASVLGMGLMTESALAVTLRCGQEGTRTTIQGNLTSGGGSGLSSVSGATLQDHTPRPIGPNLIKNGDFEVGANIDYGLSYSLRPNSQKGDPSPPFNIMANWETAGGGTATYAFWGAMSNKAGGFPEPAGASMIYFGNSFSTYASGSSGTGPKYGAALFNSDGFGQDASLHIVELPTPCDQSQQTPEDYAACLANFDYGIPIDSKPVTIKQTVTGLTQGRNYRLQFGQSLETPAGEDFAQPGVAGLQITGYNRTYFTVDQTISYRTIDFTATATTVDISFMNWGHVNLFTPPATTDSDMTVTELALDDVILSECGVDYTPSSPTTVSLSGKVYN